MVDTIKRSRLRDGIVEHLLARIRDGSFRAGDFLPNERDLAAQLGVSRGSLRDAVAQLELLGYVRARQGEGTVVLNPSGADVVRPFRSLLAGRPYLASDLLEFRLLLEPGVAGMAAERATAEDVLALRGALEAQRVAAERGGSLNSTDLSFHELIARAARNDVTLQILSGLRELMLSLRDRTMREGRPSVTIEQHAAIVEAIAKHDSRGAQQAMEAHLRTVLSRADVASVAVEALEPDGEAVEGGELVPTD